MKVSKWKVFTFIIAILGLFGVGFGVWGVVEATKPQIVLKSPEIEKLDNIKSELLSYYGEKFKWQPDKSTNFKKFGYDQRRDEVTIENYEITKFNYKEVIDNIENYMVNFKMYLQVGYDNWQWLEPQKIIELRL